MGGWGLDSPHHLANRIYPSAEQRACGAVPTKQSSTTAALKPYTVWMGPYILYGYIQTRTPSCLDLCLLNIFYATSLSNSSLTIVSALIAVFLRARACALPLCHIPSGTLACALACLLRPFSGIHLFLVNQIPQAWEGDIQTWRRSEQVGTRRVSCMGRFDVTALTGMTTVGNC